MGVCRMNRSNYVRLLRPNYRRVPGCEAHFVTELYLLHSHKKQRIAQLALPRPDLFPSFLRNLFLCSVYSSIFNDPLTLSSNITGCVTLYQTARSFFLRLTASLSFV